LAQQDITMYFVPSNPQVNTLNPAFQNTCKIFIGIPVISSIHANLGFNGFSYNNLLKSRDNSYVITPSSLNLAKVTALNGEFYVNLFSIGIWKKKNYLTFSITEKSDIALFGHRDLASVVIGGNTAYEGEKANLSRTGVFFDYRREYALGLARKINPETTIGIKGKLLFGKINVSTRKSKSDIYTDPLTYEITATSKFKIDASAPVTVSLKPDGQISDITYNGTTTGILLNRKNIGLAFDLGFIQKRTDKSTISGSILDLGAIYYTSTPNNYSVEGKYHINSQILDTVSSQNDITGFVNEAFSQFRATLDTKSYLMFLPPRIYLSYEYRLNPKTTVNALFTSKIYRYQIIPAYSVGASRQLAKNISLAASWSYMNRSINNLGVGLVAGHSPVQFYAFTDNILGFTNPLSSRNFNLRFGINLIFGCTKHENIKKCGCKWLQESINKQKRLQKLRKN
jgi:hypothetical protein